MTLIDSISIRACDQSDFEAIRETINDSALAYQGKIPAELYREPWMSEYYLKKEIDSGVCFYAAELSAISRPQTAGVRPVIGGVMGVQNVLDVTLIRHSYIRTAFRRNGIGSALIRAHLERADRPILVGCLKSMTWAIEFYQKHGFTLVSDDERDRLRAAYWNLSSVHVQNSVVLADRQWLTGKAN